jgi:hypothetical protein
VLKLEIFQIGRAKEGSDPDKERNRTKPEQTKRDLEVHAQRYSLLSFRIRCTVLLSLSSLLLFAPAATLSFFYRFLFFLFFFGLVGIFFVFIFAFLGVLSFI